jgi:hypothetical protein
MTIQKIYVSTVMPFHWLHSVTVDAVFEKQKKKVIKGRVFFILFFLQLEPMLPPFFLAFIVKKRFFHTKNMEN